MSTRGVSGGRITPALILVSGPINNMAFRPAAAGSVGCSSRRERRAYLNGYVRSEQRGKQPTDNGPDGCDENGPAAALLVGHVSIQICSALRALPAAHFDRNESHVSYGTGHWVDL
jgi:hypothetical protein